MATIGTVTINHFLYSRMPFRQEDLTAIARVSLVANGVMVNAQVPARTLQELIALAKRDPGALNYGTPGNGTSGHLCAEYLKTLSGIDITHVPFRGTGGVIPELLAGRVQIAIDNLPAYLPHIASGAVRLLAVTSAEPWFSVPQAPTVAASGFPGFEAVAWFGLQAPARTPRHIIQRYSDEMNQVIREPDMQRRLADLGGMSPNLTPDGGTSPEAFDAFIKAEIAKWGEVVRRSGARVE
jgi:tripartite-type tricarboxylate transporter receptor subunit TctC